MFMLVVGHRNGSADYYGPYPTQERALQYADSLPNKEYLRWHTVPVIIPYAVVKQIVWREQ